MINNTKVFTIIKSLFGADVGDATELLDILLDPQNSQYYSKTELEYINWFSTSINGTQCKAMPGETFFIQNYPDLEFQLNRETALNITDLTTYIHAYIKERRALTESKVLMDIAGKVQAGTATDEDLYKATELRHTDVNVSADKDAVGTLDNLLNEIDEHSKLPQGIMTGLAEIDETIGGLVPSTMSVVMGFTSQGKSLLANNIAYNAIVQGYNVIVLSLEISKLDCMFNFLSRHSNDKKFSKYDYIPAREARLNKLKPEMLEYLKTVVAPDFYSLPGKLRILDETNFSNYSFSEIKSLLQSVDDEFIKVSGKGTDLIIVDHAQLLKFGGKGSDTYSLMNEYVSFFRRMSLNFKKENGVTRGVHIMMVSQTNRGGWADADKAGGQKNQELRGMYSLTALAEANELERAANIVISIYTNIALRQSHECRCCILKNRNGAISDLPMSIEFYPEKYLLNSVTVNSVQEQTSSLMGALQSADPNNFGDLGSLEFNANDFNVDLNLG